MRMGPSRVASMGVVGRGVAFLVGDDVCTVWRWCELCASKGKFVVKLLDVCEEGSWCIESA